jgi:HK97 family phage major capsid protein
MINKIEEILSEIKNVGDGKVSVQKFNELKEAIDNRNKELDATMGNLETKMESHLAGLVEKMGNAFEKASFKQPAQAKRFQGFGEFMGKVKSRNMEIKDLAEGSGDTGGYLVPDEFSNEILKVELETSVVRNNGARVLNMNSAILRVPALSVYNNASGQIYGGATAFWGSENTAITESNPTFDRVNLEPKKLTGYVEDSNELEQDAITNMGTLLTQMFGEVLAFEEDDAFINGDGVNKPLGILVAPSLVTVSRATTSAVSTADVINMIARFRGSMDRAVFLVNQSTLPSIYKLKDENNNYIWHPGMNASVAEKAMGTLYGIPLVVTEKCPAVGTKGDIILADFGHYLIGDRGGLRTDYSQHYKFQSDQMAYRVIKRVDGQPWLKQAITPRRGGATLSPFVAIG